MANVLLLGGPCDQATRTLVRPPLGQQRITCQGQDYFVVAGPANPYIALSPRHSWVQLHGAPCDGKNLALTGAEYDKGSIMCQGHLYVNALGPRGAGQYGQAVWWEVTLLEGTAEPGPSPVPAMQAWTRLMRYLSRDGASAHKRLLQVARRANRIAR